MRRAKFAFAVACLASIPTAGCGSKEDATLSAFTQNPTLAKSDGPFGPGTVLTGSVDLVLDEGAYSQGSVSVSGITLRMFDTNNAPILADAKLDVVPPVAYPLVVNAGDRKTVHFTISIEQMSAQDQSDLCKGPVTIAGFVTQSDNTSQQTRVSGAPIKPTGC
jgi:hypothetical protein